jgi:aerobic-type carbon monoxide dehydrogenase small subunit (CoxS/CutS family)
MTTEKNTIILTLIHEGKEYQVQTSKEQYHTLMGLISDHLSLLDFGLCCGMGSCGTCMVEISEKNSAVKQFVLSCEVQISDELANARVNIPESNY